MNKTKKFLFICVENAGRSQMAEAFFRKYAPKQFLALSAGTKPGNEINPLVKQAMEEVGIDLDNQTPKLLSKKMIDNSHTTVNMGCMTSESCPELFLKDISNWQIQDPKGRSLQEVRKIRDEIEMHIKELVKNINEEK